MYGQADTNVRHANSNRGQYRSTQREKNDNERGTARTILLILLILFQFFAFNFLCYYLVFGIDSAEGNGGPEKDRKI